MIEVEKKFILNEHNKEQLTKNARFLNERVFADTYYDTENFSLTLNDKWLRSRDGRFELKLPLHNGVDRLADQYDELEDEQKIRETLDLPSSGNFADDLAKAGYVSFCTCKTTRRKYKKELFIIDLDLVDFQDFTYNIGEIELMVNDISEMESAIAKIMTFAKEQNLTIASVRGKIIEYLKRVKLNHYQALVRAGVVKDF
ncbi:MAG: thiamine-triphosphatase [Parcubacteria group bacterium Gr01-1014_48]|nr:MAG: thiamine-triphosphatase [Parcubacteria group bacterium Greene0416_14]TSC73445.1 MAG: thiamine-triphosphatase [Parcubacteria group bacterium Gr01-1014_48]